MKRIGGRDAGDRSHFINHSFFVLCRRCQKDHWTAHKRVCKRLPQPIGLPFVISIPASKATFKQLQVMAEEYAKYV